MTSTGPIRHPHGGHLDQRDHELLQQAAGYLELAGAEAYELQADNVGFLCAEALAALQKLASYSGVELGTLPGPVPQMLLPE